MRVEQVAANQLDPIGQTVGCVNRVFVRGADHTRHQIAALEQQLGQERPVLTGDAGDERPAFLG